MMVGVKISEALLDDLYQQIGRLKVELEWLKKKAAQFDQLSCGG